MINKTEVVAIISACSDAFLFGADGKKMKDMHMVCCRGAANT